MIRTVTVLLVIAAACGDDGTSATDASTRPDAVPPLRTCTPTEVEDDIFEVWCNSGRCHSGTQPAAGLDLTAGSMNRMIDQPASQCGSGSIILVVPGDPASSYLVEKVLRDPRCGAQMPLSSMLVAEDLACLESAIESLQ